MTRLSRSFFAACIVAAGAASAALPASGFPAQDETVAAADEPQPHAIAIEDLETQLLPLRRDELKGVVEEWIGRVKATMLELSDTRLAAGDAEGDEKTRLQEQAAALSEQKAALIRRAEVAAQAYETKGGDAEEYDQYLNAVAGVDVDVTDASGVWVFLRNWVTSPEGGIRLGVNILKFLITMLITWIAAKIIAGIVRRAVTRLKKTSTLLQDFLIKITRRIVWIVGFVVALSMLGVNIGPLVAAIGAAGLVIGLALQGTLSNFASGILILVYRPFDVGDVVDVAGESGKVDSMTLVSTSLITFDNKRIIIPNNEVWGNVIENATGRPTRRVDMVFGISYADDIDKARDVLRNIVTSHDKVLADPEPVIQVNELADSSVNFIVRPWSKTEDYWAVYWDIHAEVKRRFDKEGIGIPFPQMDVHVHQETA